MDGKVILTGPLPSLQLALQSMDARGATVRLDPTYFEAAAERLTERGATVVLDSRIAGTVDLELVRGDAQRLRLLQAADYAHVMAAARRAIHEHLDELIVAPPCAHCARASTSYATA